MKRIDKRPNLYIKRKFNLSDVPMEISALEALKEAVSELIADQKRTGDLIVIAYDGKVVKVPADQLGLINNLIPANEIIHQALRKTLPMYPELAVRELVANALIHQNFFVTGSGPMVEIFEDRMEITNPGTPLVQTERFLDFPPRSRNEALASLLRRIGICEERGSGIDKVVFQTEFFQLPAPSFEESGENTKATLFAHRSLTKMDKSDRIRACYLHACLRYVNRDNMTNTSLRQRFGIDQKNSAMASRLIKEALQAKVIKPYDETASRKLMRYLPFWA